MPAVITSVRLLIRAARSAAARGRRSWASALAVLALLVATSHADGAELRGRVIEVIGTDLKIQVEGDRLPQPGDPVRITFRLPAGSELSVGTWRVMRVEGDAVLASLVEATGQPAPGQAATISSPSPVPRVTASPGAAPSGSAAIPPGAAWVGLQIQPLSEAVARELGLALGMGALVVATAPGSPAQRAGLLPRDVIVAYESTFIPDPGALVELIRGSRPGTSVRLTVVRGGATHTLRVTPESRPQ